MADVTWHALDGREVEARLHTSARGLGADEVTARLAHHGPNRLREQPATPAVTVFLRQFLSPLIYILLAALVVTLLLGEHVDAAVVAVVLLLNAVIGFTQEQKAEDAVRSLMTLVVPRARVVRGGDEWEIDSSEVVEGDVVVLTAGTRVPADARVVSATGLQVDESLLTGESLPVAKSTAAVPEATVLPDRAGMAYAGSIVTAGRGTGIVVATGDRTQLGAIADLMRTETTPPTPLQRRMARFGRLIGVLVGIASVVAFASGVAVGESVQDMFLVAVALAVSAVPEGLPVAATITLAVGVRRMAARRAVIRRLPAVETLGSTTVIGSDKTGTLTQNRMEVQEVVAAGRHYRLEGGAPGGAFLEGDEPAAVADGSALERILLAAALDNEADVFHRDGELVTTGDPTEVALLTAAMVVGIEPQEARLAYPAVADLPFDARNRFSACLRRHHDQLRVFVKGAPEQVIERCTSVPDLEGTRPVDREAVRGVADDLAARGLRVLAVAERDAGPGAESEVADPRDLVLLGLVAMMDPPRPGVREAIADCRDAGIRVLMITGDHAVTAEAIARDLGIQEDGRVATGADLAGLAGDDLRAVVQGTNVFARVSPEDKLQIVETLRADHEVVAVTGDGVNDAPALRAAEIGIAMGQGGTDVAREASDMVLTDDDFVSIVAAVEEGRVTFDNIQKVTFFLIATGVAEVLAILGAVWLQWPLLLLPAQLLWLNLVTNGLQDVALAFEPGEEGVLRRPPRDPGEGVLSRLLWERTLVAAVVMAVGTLVMFRWQLDAGGSLDQARSVALTTMVVFQVFQAGNARSEAASLLTVPPWTNPFLLVATVASLGVHVAALYLPFTQFVLDLEPVALDAWLRIVVVAFSVVVAMELHKLLRSRRRYRSEARGA